MPAKEYKMPEMVIPHVENKDTLYTWEEIRKHNKDTDCWVVLYKNVLDVTPWLNRHPGGLNPICDLGGYDITNTFEALGHTDTRAVEIQKKFIIGKLDPNSVEPKVVKKFDNKISEDELLKFSVSAWSLNSVHIIVAVIAIIVLFICFM